jgi:hypothetical protein
MLRWRWVRPRTEGEAAYLQTDDEKPAIIAEPRPRQVPNTFAVIALTFICNECVAKFAGWYASGGLGLHGNNCHPPKARTVGGQARLHGKSSRSTQNVTGRGRTAHGGGSSDVPMMR